VLPKQIREFVKHLHNIYMIITYRFKIPRYPENDEMDRRSQMLNIMINLNVLLALSLVLTHFFSYGYATERMWATVGLIIFMLFLKIPHHFGFVNQSCKAFVLSLLIAVTYGTSNAGGIRAPVAIAFIAVPVCAVLLQSLRFVILTFMLVSLSILGIILAEQGHLLPPAVPDIHVDQWIIQSEIIIWLTAVTYLTVRNLIHTRTVARKELQEKEHALAALKHNEGLLSSVFKCSPAALVVTSMKDRKLLRVNDTFINLMGYNKEELIGKRTDRLDIWENKEDLLRIYEKSTSSSELSNEEIKFRKKDGSFVNGLLSATIVDAENEKLLVFGYFDLTDREAVEKMRLDLERQVFETQKEELKSEFQRKELNQARDLQHYLLPPGSFTFPPYQVNCMSLTATEVGGDYYDYLTLPSGKLIIVIGDVSGHGLSSGLLMSMVKASLYSIVQDSADMDKVIQTLNNIVRLGGKQQKMFLTFCYVILDPGAGMLSCSINGHPFPLLRKADGEILELVDSSYPLGIRQDVTIKIIREKLASGDKILLYTDGIPEITNKADEPFGYKSLIDYARENGNLRGDDFVKGLFQAAFSHADGKPQDDDMTALCVEID
jgi:PAS domain S-box-containing protein